ncbi:hypothetical protein KPATCC21470_8633 [Kitasatospora purpeofusca]
MRIDETAERDAATTFVCAGIVIASTDLLPEHAQPEPERGVPALGPRTCSTGGELPAGAPSRRPGPADGWSSSRYGERRRPARCPARLAEARHRHEPGVLDVPGSGPHRPPERPSTPAGTTRPATPGRRPGSASRSRRSRCGRSPRRNAPPASTPLCRPSRRSRARSCAPGPGPARRLHRIDRPGPTGTGRAPGARAGRRPGHNAACWAAMHWTPGWTASEAGAPHAPTAVARPAPPAPSAVIRHSGPGTDAPGRGRAGG